MSVSLSLFLPGDETLLDGRVLAEEWVFYFSIHCVPAITKPVRPIPGCAIQRKAAVGRAIIVPPIFVSEIVSIDPLPIAFFIHVASDP